MIEQGKTNRAGLLGTQGIRGGSNRVVLQRIKDTGDIFMAHSDRLWNLPGASVQTSIVGFDDGTDKERMLDGDIATNINSNLTSGLDLTQAIRLRENKGTCFQGQIPSARFDISPGLAAEMLAEPLNVNGRSNSDVVLPVLNGEDIAEQHRGMYTINFGLMSLDEASKYEMPFEYVKEHIYSVRQEKSQTDNRKAWWQYVRPRPAMRKALAGLERLVVTPRVSKHRIFIWVKSISTVCTDATVVFAYEDDHAFGVLHSRIHELWARAIGTQLREAESGFRYSHTATFETFPFPHPTSEQREAIATAARELNQLRENWRTTDPKRTLTGLYNSNPTWLQNAHANLDKSVADAYGWPADLPNHQVLENLLALNLQRHAEE